MMLIHLAAGNISEAKDNTDTELMQTIKRAGDFHGHLGPFLVIGVRIGLIGVRELRVKEKEKKFHVTAMLEYSVPFSCVVDGIQVATKCTMGNKRLRLKNDSSRIAAKFELQDGEKEDSSPEKIQGLAHAVASVPEEELLIIRSR